jgi:D-tagatose-1,6-bisphosphate aldolase subunit GatZ/KbaZ
MAEAPTVAAGLGGPGPLLEVVTAQKRGEPRGIWSCCSAHPDVIDTAFRAARDGDAVVLVEATSNQVNQEGGYTGITPGEFAAALVRTAQGADFPAAGVLFGGDHLGPHPWQVLPAAEAMARARQLVREYVQAGAAKIHLDASMRLADDPPGVLNEEVAAARTADLAEAAEGSRLEDAAPPVFIVGTEVPVPGGERDDDAPRPTRPEDAARTLDLTREAFRARGLTAAWERVIGLVVQPGVEFSQWHVHDYDPAVAAELSRFIEGVPGMVYEAHSTDHQQDDALRALVRDHFAILKVGPRLTFAWREAVFALAAVEEEWLGGRAGVTLSGLPSAVDEVMRSDPAHWRGYYQGNETELRVARRFSLSDRIRYYWPRTGVKSALARLLENLERHPAPLPLLSQYLPGPCRAVRDGRLRREPSDLVRFHVREAIEPYVRACAVPLGASGPSVGATQ